MSNTSGGARLGGIVLVAFLTFLLVEGMATVTALRFGESTQWFSPSAHERIGFLDGPGQDQGINTVFVGSSVVASGFDAARYDAITENQTTNMGLPGADLALTQRWLSEQVLPRLEDRNNVQRVVFGLTTMAVNGNADTTTFERYLDQPATTPGWRGSLQRTAFDRLALVRHAMRWSNPATAASDFADPPDSEAFTTPFFDLPLAPTINLAVVEDPNNLRPQRLVDFEIGDAQRAILQDLFADLATRDIEVVVVLVPVHSGYADRHPNGQVGLDAARTTLRRETDAAGVRFVDLSTAIDDEFFLDHVHTEPEGIRLVAELLACEIDQICA